MLRAPFPFWWTSVGAPWCITGQYEWYVTLDGEAWVFYVVSSIDCLIQAMCGGGSFIIKHRAIVAHSFHRATCQFPGVPRSVLVACWFGAPLSVATTHTWLCACLVCVYVPCLYAWVGDCVAATTVSSITHWPTSQPGCYSVQEGGYLTHAKHKMMINGLLLPAIIFGNLTSFWK